MTLRRRPRSAALLRLGYRVAYRALQVWAFVRRPRVHGTMVVVSDDAGRIMLVRHPYGDRRRWDLPGGRAHRGEDARVAAARELLEEVGLDVPVEPVGAVSGAYDFKHEELSYFAARMPAGLRAPYDPVEIAEVAWFDPRLPPARLGKLSAAVLGAYSQSRA